MTNEEFKQWWKNLLNKIDKKEQLTNGETIILLFVALKLVDLVFGREKVK